MTDHERFVRGEGVREELPRRSVRSGVATVTARGAQMALQMASVMVLARMLTPEDFGVQAMVLPVAILVNSIANLGLQTTVIHREHLEHRETSAMFWLALRVNLGITLLMAFSAPLLAWFYDDPRVTGVALAWAAIIYCATLSAFHEALLKRQMLFGTVLKAQLGAMLASLVMAIAAALLGAGYWALMVQIAVLELVRVATIWVVCPWRPAVRASRNASAGTDTAVRELRTYWAHLSGSRVLALASDQLDRVVVGATSGAMIVGLYDSAKRWAWFPFIELWLPLSDVAVASLSRVQSEADKYRLYVRNAFLLILSLSLPVIAFIFVEARAVLHVLLGDQWSNATGFVRLMCIAAIGGSVSRLMQWLYLSSGQTERQLRWTLYSTPILVALVLVGARGGAIGVATWFAIGTCALALPSAAYALRYSPVTIAEIAPVFARPMVASLAAAAVLGAIGEFLPATQSALANIAIRMPIFIATYALVWVGLWGGARAVREMIAGVREIRRCSYAPSQPLRDRPNVASAGSVQT